MIPKDAIAIITPHGRYQRFMRGRKDAPKDQRLATGTTRIDWRSDARVR